MIRGLISTVAASIAALATTSAQAELTLCNRTSFRMEAAIGLEKRANVTTRGWFRLDPGQCRQMIDGPLDVDMVYLHARAPPIYGSGPSPQTGQADFCIRDGDFEIADARGCPTSQQVRFSAAKPTDSPKGPVVNLAEESDYDDVQARLAGIQRLLVIAGYDAAPIDGVDGPKTQGALSAFMKNRGLSSDILQSQNFFSTMIEAVQSPSPIGLTWCNDTPHKIMAAVATDDGKAVISRGWYRIDPGKCLHPDVTGQPKQVFSFAEAVDAENRAIRYKDKPLNWGGSTQLCTRDNKFETSEQGDCGSRGFSATGFGAVDISGGGKTLRFAMP
jgi:uncharacterized membrane protein